MWILSSTACLARIRRARNPLRVQLGIVDILPGLKSGDSYGLHAYAGIPSVGSCHDALTACEGCEQGRKPLTALVPDWAVEDSIVRSCSRGFGVGGSFLQCAFASIFW